jgi:PGF-CTERM protein
MNNTFDLVFIDLNVGVLCLDGDLIDLTDSGAVKIEYSFENLHSFAAFNAYAWCNQSNRGKGVFWTNRLTGGQHNGYSVISTALPVVASITVSPSSITLNVGDTQQFDATAYDQYGDGMLDIIFMWRVSNKNTGTIGENGLFTALAPGNATITAEHGAVNGTAKVTVHSEDGEEYEDEGDSHPSSVPTAINILPPSETATIQSTPEPAPAPTEMPSVNVTPSPCPSQSPTTTSAAIQHPSPIAPSSTALKSAGFGALFAFIGLLAVAYLIKRRS